MDLKARCADYCLTELHRRDSTVTAYRYRWGRLETYFGKPIERVTDDDLRALKRASPFAPATVKGFIVAVHVFHDWGALNKLWERNGISLVKVPPRIHAIPNPLAPRRARTVLDACRRPLEYRVAYLGLYAGMRIGESAALAGWMWGEDDVLRFEGEKNGRPREIPVHQGLAKAKWMILASLPTDDSTLQRVVRRLRDRVGFHFTSHQFRDTFATQLEEADTERHIIKDLLGHAGDVTSGYAQVSLRKKRVAIGHLQY